MERQQTRRKNGNRFAPPRNRLTSLGVRCGYTIGETLLLNAERESSALVIVGQLTQLRVLLREGKELVFAQKKPPQHAVAHFIGTLILRAVVQRFVFLAV